MTLFILLTAMACIAAPLLIYSLSLALLGLPHVLVELRYVQQRFGRRVMRRTAAAMGALLLGVVGLRVARNLGWSAPFSWELFLVIGLVAVVLPALGWRWRGLASSWWWEDCSVRSCRPFTPCCCSPFCTT